MTMSTTFEQLRALDLAMLTDVVRQDQRDPDFEITEWAVRRLSDRGFASEDGPFCFYGHGRSGPSVRSWSVVLKFSATPQDTQLAPTSLWCFKREWLVYQAASVLGTGTRGMFDLAPPGELAERHRFRLQDARRVGEDLRLIYVSAAPAGKTG